jgi:NAD(P)-dependent dehydrogenase (short-subunit alcohol dehydrogenase family)
LKGRKALVTGGDSGIGRAARAIAFAREPMLILYPAEETSDAQEVLKLTEAEGRKGRLPAIQ